MQQVLENLVGRPVFKFSKFMNCFDGSFRVIVEPFMHRHD